MPAGLQFFKAFDVFVLTSIKEPFGMVLIEAMAAGVPVVSSRTGGLSEFVGESGVFFTPGNTEELARVLDEVFGRERADRQIDIDRAHKRLLNHFSLVAFRERFMAFPFYPGSF